MDQGTDPIMSVLLRDEKIVTKLKVVCSPADERCKGRQFLRTNLIALKQQSCNIDVKDNIV